MVTKLANNCTLTCDQETDAGCLTILNGFDSLLGFIPFLPFAGGAIKYVCYDLHKLAQELELENRIAIRKALIEIAAAIFTAPDTEDFILLKSKRKEIDMNETTPLASSQKLSSSYLSTPTAYVRFAQEGSFSSQALKNISTDKDIKSTLALLKNNKSIIDVETTLFASSPILSSIDFSISADYARLVQEGSPSFIDRQYSSKTDVLNISLAENIFRDFEFSNAPFVISPPKYKAVYPLECATSFLGSALNTIEVSKVDKADKYAPIYFFIFLICMISIFLFLLFV